MPGNLMFWILFYFLTYDVVILEEGKKKQPYMQQPRTVTSSKESLTVWLWQTKKIFLWNTLQEWSTFNYLIKSEMPC